MKIFYILIIVCINLSSLFSSNDNLQRRQEISAQSDSILVDNVIAHRKLEGNQRYSYSYDNNRNIKLVLEQQLHNDVWEDSSKTMFNYNENNKIIKAIVQLWENGAWKDVSNSSCSYDAKGNLIDTLSDYWYYGDHKVDHQKNTYNSFGKIVQNEKEYWKNSLLDRFYRVTYNYDKNSNLIELLTEQFKDPAWINVNRTTNTFDSTNNLATQILESWSNGQWVKGARYTFTYDSLGNNTTKVTEFAQNNELVNWSRSSITYNSKGKFKSKIDESWQNTQWNFSTRETWTYDSNDLLTLKLGERWLNMDWSNTDRSYYTYNAKGSLLTYTNEKWNNSQWEPWNLWLSFKDSEGRLFSIASCKLEVTYGGFVSVVGDLTYPDTLIISPNPATDFIDIKNNSDVSDLIIYNSFGDLIGTIHPFTSTQRLNIENYPSGIYFVRDGKRISKFIKN